MSDMLQDWVTAAAQRRPDARAIVSEDATMTYREIDDYSSRLARLLWERGCRRGDRVAVLMPTSARAVASLVGVLKAGCAYVPIDPTGGMVRAADMLRQCDPTVVLAGGCDPAVIMDLEGRRALCHALVGWMGPGAPPKRANFTLGDVSSTFPEVPTIECDPDDLAYILFTSGTTGSPKGVPISHASVRSLIEWAVDEFELGPEDRLSGHSAMTYDLSTFDIYATFAAGAELHHVPEAARSTPRGVADFIEERRLTLWFSVPSQLSHVARVDGLVSADLSSLRHVAWCGDVLPTPSLLYWKERLPGVSFTNLYGPTETTVASSYYRVPDDFDDPYADIPIGVACRGEELLVLDENLRPVLDGEVGDLFIRGVGLSPGYWRDPERSRAAFLPDPDSTDGSGRIYRTGDRARRSPDGVVHFLGRADFQIRTSGYRVELAEVENAVLQLGEISACAVVPVTASDSSGSLVACAYVPSNGKHLLGRELERRLEDTLPTYMVPARWLVLDELPVDGRGKIDRRRAQVLMGG